MFVELRRRKWFPLALVALALLATLASRLAVARYLANDSPDDGRVYAQLANNLLEHHVFSHADKAPYDPSIIRLPGYPLFLAAVYSIFGHGNNTAVRMVQAVCDTATCVIIALIAWNWVRDEKRRRVAAWSAFALAALCPFTAIYVATILTETLTTFFMTAMTLTATYAFKAPTRKATIIWWIVTGLLAGAGVELRPDSGLAAAAIGLTLLISGLRKSKDEGGRRKDESSVDEDQTVLSSFRLHPSSLLFRLARTVLYGAIFSLAFILVLVPWTIRNARVFHVFQPLAPAHGEMPGEFVAHGYFVWVRTWIDDPRYIEPALWNLDDKPISVDALPDNAFASADERARVAALLERYNHPPPDEQADTSDNQPAETAKNDVPQPDANLPPADAKALPSNNNSSANNSSPANKNSSTQPEQAKSQSGNQNNKNSNNESDDNADDDQSDNNNDDSNDDDHDDADEADQSQDEAQQSQDEQSVEMTPEIDTGFAQLARERIARAPFRYYVWLPLKRAAALWFDTHSGYYSFEGELFPLDDLDHDTNQHIWLPLFAALVWLHTLLAVAGAILLWLARDGASRRWLLLAVLMTLPRLIFFSMLENPEPRYVIELFAFTSILGGIAIARFSLKGLLAAIRRRHKRAASTTDAGVK